MKFLFDLGGVFFDWDPNYFFKNIFSDSSEKAYFFEKICSYLTILFFHRYLLIMKTQFFCVKNSYDPV